MKLCRTYPARAFTFVELLVVMAMLFVLATLLLPALRPAKARSSKVNCTNHMKQIGLAFRSWALDHNDNYPMHVPGTNGGTMESVPNGLAYVHFQVLSNELSTPKILVCPSDTKRLPATNFTTDFNNQKISYFVGLDLAEPNPQTFLSGDRNLTNALGIRAHVLTLTTNAPTWWTSQIHANQGNICMADGSVQGWSNSGLRTALQATGAATNRLAMP